MRGCVSPIPLLGFLLQAGQQGVEAVVVAVQQPGGQVAEVSVVLLVEERESQVTPGPDVLQDKLQHVFFHRPFKLCYKLGEELHSDLPNRFTVVILLKTATGSVVGLYEVLLYRHYMAVDYSAILEKQTRVTAGREGTHGREQARHLLAFEKMSPFYQTAPPSEELKLVS